jgi:hypothetical protein
MSGADTGSRRLQRVPQDLPRQEQIAATQALLDEIDRHMKQWVSERSTMIAPNSAL